MHVRQRVAQHVKCVLRPARHEGKADKPRKQKNSEDYSQP